MVRKSRSSYWGEQVRKTLLDDRGQVVIAVPLKGFRHCNHVLGADEEDCFAQVDPFLEGAGVGARGRGFGVTSHDGGQEEQVNSRRRTEVQGGSASVGIQVSSRSCDGTWRP